MKVILNNGWQFEGTPAELYELQAQFDAKGKQTVSAVDAELSKPAKTRAEIVAQAKREVAMSRSEFIVNREKRTVVALLRSTNKIIARGIAKCAPGDVFNADIGKAIARRRAFGVSVPAEYVNAPQPEGVEVGDVVLYSGTSGKTFIHSVVTSADIAEINRYNNSTTLTWKAKIIDDTDRASYQ